MALSKSAVTVMSTAVPQPPHVVEARRRRLPPVDQGRPLWLLTPVGVLLAAVVLVPLVLAVVMSTLQLDQYTISNWLAAPSVFLNNFVEAFTRSNLLNSVWISVSYAFLATLGALPFGVAAALATQNRFRGRGIVRSLYLLPYILPTFVVGTVWATILTPGGMLGHDLWLNGPRAYWTLVVVSMWTQWPFFYLMTLAGLQTVDHEVHEAVAIDGAGWWQKLIYVIFPYLRGSVALAGVIAFLHLVNAFTLPYTLFSLPAPNSVAVMPMLTFSASFVDLRFGLASAMAIVALVLVAIPLFWYLRAVRLDRGDEGGR